jgi:hypothetical protein
MRNNITTTTLNNNNNNKSSSNSNNDNDGIQPPVSGHARPSRRQQVSISRLRHIHVNEVFNSLFSIVVVFLS